MNAVLTWTKQTAGSYRAGDYRITRHESRGPWVVYLAGEALTSWPTLTEGKGFAQAHADKAAAPVVAGHAYMGATEEHGGAFYRPQCECGSDLRRVADVSETRRAHSEHAAEIGSPVWVETVEGPQRGTIAGAGDRRVIVHGEDGQEWDVPRRQIAPRDVAAEESERERMRAEIAAQTAAERPQGPSMPKTHGRFMGRGERDRRAARRRIARASRRRNRR